ncbi:MAG: Flp pilus assembly protein CpaB [Phenylobacterium sp.]|uniref:Flp pilus assembly protein CpaB n=1 Tax=Phenylobacterium sp. TaxID=1871053 RepID=UPI003918AEF2
MGALRIAILAIAAIAAIAVALLVRGMMAPKPQAPVAAEAGKPMARVLVAQRDLPIGATLVAADVGWQAWPVESLNATFITDGAAPAPEAKGAAKVAKAAGDLVAGPGPIEALEGAVVKEPILKGEPIIARKIVRGGEGGYMAVVLQPGMRAVAVPISNETTAGGFVLPGDRVDVMQSRDAGGDRGFVTETLLRNVRVLAIDQSLEPGKDAKSMVGSVATLEVPAQDASVLVRGRAQGQMVLVLRAYSDIGGPVGRGGGGENTTVRVFRADKATEVAVR